jgi:hypothetical protein
MRLADLLRPLAAGGEVGLALMLIHALLIQRMTFHRPPARNETSQDESDYRGRNMNNQLPHRVGHKVHQGVPSLEGSRRKRSK